MHSVVKARALLTQVGLRVTAPRLAILSALVAQPDWHASVEALYQHLVAQASPVNVSSCYRILHELAAAGLVERRALDAERSVYELVKETRHDHMVSPTSGQVVEFQEPRLDTLLEEIARAHGFELLDRHLVLYVRAKPPETALQTA